MLPIGVTAAGWSILMDTLWDESPNNGPAPRPVFVATSHMATIALYRCPGTWPLRFAALCLDGGALLERAYPPAISDARDWIARRTQNHTWLGPMRRRAKRAPRDLTGPRAPTHGTAGEERTRSSGFLFRMETGALELLDDATEWAKADGARVAQRTGTDDLLFASNLVVPAAVAASCRPDRATILVETVGPGWDTLAPAEYHGTLGDALAACQLRMREVWHLGLLPRPAFP